MIKNQKGLARSALQVGAHRMCHRICRSLPVNSMEVIKQSKLESLWQSVQYAILVRAKENAK